MQALPPAIHGLILDHLRFHDILQATTTDRAGRHALGHVRCVFNIKARALTSPKIMSKIGKCESLAIMADCSNVLERLAWALTAVPHLRHLRVTFRKHAVLSDWRVHCEALSRSMEDVTRFETFRVCFNVAAGPLFFVFKPLDQNLLHAAAYHDILFRLPLDCALRAAVHGAVPCAVVEKLIDRGANVNSMHEMMYGGLQSILSLACMHQTHEVVSLLLSKGARDSKLEEHDCFLAAMNRGHDLQRSLPLNSAPAIINLLHKAGFRSWYRTNDQGGLLHFAMSDYAKGEQIPSIQLIVALIAKHQPEVATLSDRRGHTPLSLLIGCMYDVEDGWDEQDTAEACERIKMAKDLSACEREQREIQSYFENG